MIEQITPVILTYNEAPNIARSLEKLGWARDVVIVDSNSSDETLELAGRFPSVRCFQRGFDSFAGQWTYAIHETGIQTDWVLTLDADYILTDEFIDELRALDPEPGVAGFTAPFVYCVFGRKLRASVYPPVTVLYHRHRAKNVDQFHTYDVVLDGELRALKTPILHDDRKPLGLWLRAQDRYMKLECEKIRATPWKELNWPDRLRKLRIVAPFVMLLYCLIARGGVLDGWPGWFYAFQRMTAELILSIHLLTPRQ